MFRDTKNIHFVGIGGIGMSGIAEVLINLGFNVSGSDIKESETIDKLHKIGAKVDIGHKIENVRNVDVLVYSSAVKLDNPEIIEARKLGVPVIRRAEMMGEMMRLKFSIAIAGTHGKTTTTSMIASEMLENAMDPSVIVGGIVRSFGGSAKLGSGKYFVCEADESDKSFLKLFPTIAVVTNIDEDHLDNYTSIDDIKKSFVEYINSIPFYGCSILSMDDRNIQSILLDINKRYITYGFLPQADIRAKNIEIHNFSSKFDVAYKNFEIKGIQLKIPGEFNIKNALAAIAVGIEIGIPDNIIKQSIEKFHGVHRRFEYKGEVKGCKLYDDYAHHPTEIESTLKAARDAWEGRIIAIFQPHLFSRTMMLREKFGGAFYNADIVIITDIYPAREKPVKGVTGKTIADSCIEHRQKHVIYEKNKDNIPAILANILKEGDMIITMGAGDIYKISEKYIDDYGKH
jgi:UDP-N-acetylmuramate--alanine ligase